MSFNLPTLGWDAAFRLEQTTALPVEIVGFYGKNVNNQYAQLDWETASEINIHDYDVESSRDAAHFNKIGNVVSVDDNGGGHSYVLNDSTARPGINYYRLNIHETGGMSYYSKTIAVDFGANGSALDLAVFPNPTVSDMQMRFNLPENGLVSYALTDAAGRAVLAKSGISLSVGEQNIGLPIQGLPQGIYFLTIQTEGGMMSAKIVKE